VYKYLNKKGLARRIYIRIAKINIGLITCMEGMKLFIKNKHFRADVWTHKSEIIKLLKDDN